MFDKPTHGAHGLNRHLAEQRQGGVVATARGHGLGRGGAALLQRHQPWHLGQGERLPGRHHEGAGQAAVQIAQAPAKKRRRAERQAQAAPQEFAHIKKTSSGPAPAPGP